MGVIESLVQPKFATILVKTKPASNSVLIIKSKKKKIITHLILYLFIFFVITVRYSCKLVSESFQKLGAKGQVEYYCIFFTKLTIYSQNSNRLYLHPHRSWMVMEQTWMLCTYCSNARSLICFQRTRPRNTGISDMYFFFTWKNSTKKNLKTINNFNHRLFMHEGEFEIQNGLYPCKSQHDIQNLNTCS